jgi:hypothetical protein
MFESCMMLTTTKRALAARQKGYNEVWKGIKAGFNPNEK